MATHSSIPAWRIPWREEPCGLQSMRPQSSTRLSDSYSHTSAGTALSGSQFRKLSVITVVISGLRLRALFSLHPWRFLCFPHLKVQICGGFCEPRHTVG